MAVEQPYLPIPEQGKYVNEEDFIRFWNAYPRDGRPNSLKLEAKRAYFLSGTTARTIASMEWKDEKSGYLFKYEYTSDGRKTDKIIYTMNIVQWLKEQRWFNIPNHNNAYTPTDEEKKILENLR